MRNLGKEAKTLLLGITIVCVLSLLFAFGISSVLTKSFQSSLVNHDYGVAGYLLNHDVGLSSPPLPMKRAKRTFSAVSMRCLCLGITKPFQSDCSRQFPYIRIKSCCPCVVFCFLFFAAILRFLILYLRRQAQSGLGCRAGNSRIS